MDRIHQLARSYTAEPPRITQLHSACTRCAEPLVFASERERGLCAYCKALPAPVGVDDSAVTPPTTETARASGGSTR